MITLGRGTKNRVNDGYTGHLVENEILRPCVRYCSGCRSYDELVNMVMNSQPVKYNPFDPNPRVINDLHMYIAMALGVDCGEVGLYMAFRTQLDYDYGIDFFVKYGNQIVTVDVTVNSCKDEYRADFIFNVNNYDTGQGTLQEFGKKIAEALRG
mgnify:CR=1 FL=1